MECTRQGSQEGKMATPFWTGVRATCSMYTYAKHPINSTSCSCGKRELSVNIANGDLIAHTTDLQITGTAGLDLNIDGYYNSLSNSSTDHGHGWNFSLGYDVRLDLSDPSTGITLYGPSGYQAYFAYDSNNGNYTDAPGLNATLAQGSGSAYELTFHQTGVQWIFNADNGGHLTEIRDQNLNKITFAYDSSYDITSITDTQHRTITFTNNTVFGTSHHPEGQVTQITDPASIKPGDLTSLDRYIYSNDDPVNVLDPTGRAGVSDAQLFDCVSSLILAVAAIFIADIGIGAALEVGTLGLATPVVIIAAIVMFLFNVGTLGSVVAEKCPFLIG